MPNDYKDTLNLPQTDFPMKANLAQKEPLMLTFWGEHRVYEKLQEKRKDAVHYILHDGPPYANGHIHIGHALNKILKDMIVKYKSMRGFYSPYVPGWDCHGLPIELNVEKKVGKPGRKVDAAGFRKACQDYAGKQVDGQRKDFIDAAIAARVAQFFFDDIDPVFFGQVTLGQNQDTARDLQQLQNLQMFPGLRHDPFVDIDDQQDQVDAADTGEHVMDELFMAWYVDHADHAAVGQLERRKPQVNRNTALLLFLEAVGVDAGELVDQDRLAVVNVSGCADDVIAV